MSDSKLNFLCIVADFLVSAMSKESVGIACATPVATRNDCAVGYNFLKTFS